MGVRPSRSGTRCWGSRSVETTVIRHAGSSFPRCLPKAPSRPPANVSGVEGPERIAPPQRPSQGDSGIPQGSIRADRQRRHGAPPGTPEGTDRTGRGAGRGPFDTPSREAISSAGRRRAMCPEGYRRVCVPLGVHGATVPRGRMERIPDSPDEADLPAQEAPSRQGARLPRPHEDDSGSPYPRRPAGSGSEAADGLTTGRGTTTPRLVMLSRPQDFAAIQGSGTIRSHPLMSARFLRTDLDTTRFGFSTGRRLGGAVVRNRVRRRLREALRVMAPSFQPGWDVLIIARPAIVEADHDALVGALRRILVRGGVVGGGVR